MRPSAVYLLIAAAVLVPAPALGQEPETDAEESRETGGGTGFRVGVKAGASWSVLGGSLPTPEGERSSFEGAFGFAVGASMEFRLGEKLSLQPEALIVRKHTELDLGTAAGERRDRLSVNYFEIPLLVKWYPSGRRGAQGNLVLGPTLALRMDALREIRTADSIEDVEAKDLVQADDWGITVGGGLEFHEFLWALTVDLRYFHGITNINATDSADAARWRVIYMVVGATF